jgi:hypothetical protein
MSDPDETPAAPGTEPAPLPPEVLKPDPDIIREVTTGVVVDQHFNTASEAEGIS